MKRVLILLVFLAAAGGVLYYVETRPRPPLVLTGIVTTDPVIVSSEIQGRIESLGVTEGDAVSAGQLLAVVEPRELEADLAYSESAKKEAKSRVEQAKAVLQAKEATVKSGIAQAEAELGSAKATVAQGSAELENLKLTLDRVTALHRRGVDPAEAYDRARTAYQAQVAHVEMLKKNVVAAKAAVALARSGLSDVEASKAALAAAEHLVASADAQVAKARTRLHFTEIHAPIAGVVDTRVALEGEVVNPSQAILTLVNPDDLWIRADVAETYIDRIHLGEKLSVRLPSGATRQGTVFFRAVDADYATERDVSRTKRDIKTFEIRLRCDNRDRSLAVGMTAYVTLPFTE